MGNYTISLEDIRGYLATVPEGGSVGIPQHRYECLIANTLKHCYPDKLIVMGFDNTYARVDGEWIDIPAGVALVADRFDSLWTDVNLEDESTYGTPVTVATLQELIPEIWDENLIGDQANA